MIDLLISWGPLVFFMAAFLYFAKRSSSKYGGHIDDVMRINQENAELARQTHALTREQIDVLKQIKSLLEDRKS